MTDFDLTIIKTALEHQKDNIEDVVVINKGMSNGDVIKAMFGVKEVDMSNTYCIHFPEEEDYSHYFFKDWWNSLYQKGGKE